MVHIYRASFADIRNRNIDYNIQYNVLTNKVHLKLNSKEGKPKWIALNLACPQHPCASSRMFISKYSVILYIHTNRYIGLRFTCAIGSSHLLPDESTQSQSHYKTVVSTPSASYHISLMCKFTYVFQVDKS